MWRFRKHFLWFVFPILLAICSTQAVAQPTAPQITYVTAVPGSCSATQLFYNISNGTFYTCVAGVPTAVGGGGGGTVTIVTGTPNEIDVATGTTTPVISLDATAINDAIAYCSDTGTSDTYACSTPVAIPYVTGARYRFKANTANTGAATINFTAQGAKTIVKVAGGVTTALADNDIRVGQVVDLVYDGTNMQMQSTLGNAASGGATFPAMTPDGEICFALSLNCSTSASLIYNANPLMSLAPSVTTMGTPGGETWGYKFIPYNSVGLGSGANAAEGTVLTGAAALNATDYNVVTPSCVGLPSGTLGDIYITIAPMPSGTAGLIANAQPCGVAYLDQVGQALNFTQLAPPIADSSVGAGISHLGPVVIGAVEATLNPDIQNYFSYQPALLAIGSGTVGNAQQAAIGAACDTVFECGYFVAIGGPGTFEADNLAGEDNDFPVAITGFSSANGHLAGSMYVFDAFIANSGDTPIAVEYHANPIRKGTLRYAFQAELNADETGFVAQRESMQIADMFQMLDTDGTTKLAFFDKDGILQAAGYLSSDGTLGTTGNGFKNGLCVTTSGACIGGALNAFSGTTGPIGGGLLTAGSCASGTVSVASSTTAMVALADPNTYPGDGIFWDAQVTTNGTVTVKVCAAIALTPSASTYNVRVIQ